jgi:hypothetical protein
MPAILTLMAPFLPLRSLKDLIFFMKTRRSGLFHPWREIQEWNMIQMETSNPFLTKKSAPDSEQAAGHETPQLNPSRYVAHRKARLMNRVST